MVIAADNITVDLAGYDVSSDGEDSIRMNDRSGVLIKNGSAGGRAPFTIKGGKNNSLRDLFIEAGEDGGPIVIDTKNGKLERIDFQVRNDAGAVIVGGKGTTVSDSTFRTVGDARGAPLLVLRAGTIALRNTFFGASKGRPSVLVGARARMEFNTIEWEPEFAYPPGQNLLAAVVVQGDGAAVRSNSIRISGRKDDFYSRIIAVRVDGSRNTVQDNTIITSAPEVASVGVFVSPESTKDLILRNRISIGDSPDDVGIYVLGSYSKIIGNTTDSVVDEGSNNSIRRNAATIDLGRATLGG
jgi:hypothetical protein